jgi:fused signal recognition particle receptor
VNAVTPSQGRRALGFGTLTTLLCLVLAPPLLAQPTFSGGGSSSVAADSARDAELDAMTVLRDVVTSGRDEVFWATAMSPSTAIDDQLLEELENRLLLADLGMDATTSIIDDLQQRVSKRQITEPDQLIAALRDNMLSILEPCSRPLEIPDGDRPFVILMVGVNGVGKTTTIGKLARRLKDNGLSVMLAAGDTFRAAAVEQLQEWGKRNDVPVVAQGTGADPASVIFDAVQSASSKNIDIIIADTAGRLHTQDNLMDELAKIKRVLAKIDADAPHETLIVMDASFGQNALHQVQQFHDSIGLTGLAVTKLDGTAKGGILFSIAETLKLPVRFIGIGEGIDDLRPFHAGEFVDALLE